MSQFSKTKVVEAEIEIDGEIYAVEFVRDSTTYFEDDYGADADGNRGMGVELISNDSFAHVLVNEKPLESFRNSFQAEVKQQIENWCEDNFPERTR